jgi:hypothetical protein
MLLLERIANASKAFLDTSSDLTRALQVEMDFYYSLDKRLFMNATHPKNMFFRIASAGVLNVDIHDC